MPVPWSGRCGTCTRASPVALLAPFGAQTLGQEHRRGSRNGNPQSSRVLLNLPFQGRRYTQVQGFLCFGHNQNTTTLRHTERRSEGDAIPRPPKDGSPLAQSLMALIELFAADLATTTVSAGGTDAPSAGTVETLIVASAAMFGTAVAGVSQFHFADAAPGRGSEICAATATSGTTWTVTRGADETTPVTHEAGFQIVQVFTAGWLASLVQTTGAAPSAGAAPISDASGNARWKGIFGTRPEWFGTISGTSGDEVAINAAIAAVARSEEHTSELQSLR